MVTARGRDMKEQLWLTAYLAFEHQTKAERKVNLPPLTGRLNDFLAKSCGPASVWPSAMANLCLQGAGGSRSSCPRADLSPGPWLSRIRWGPATAAPRAQGSRFPCRESAQQEAA